MRLLFFLILVGATAAPAQKLSWRTGAALYGDNTEFFTPYRVGETILGGQFASMLRLRAGKHSEIDLGLFGDHRSGSDRFIHPFRPIIAYHFRDANTHAVLGTLFPRRRHGFIEPLQSALYELTRPIEYGLGWIERKRFWSGDVFLNWQKLNLASQREVFDYGGVLRLTPVKQIAIEGQLHGVHHGGQLFDAGQPVTNNVARGMGVVISDTLGVFGRTSLAWFRLKAGGGSGTYVRGAITPFAFAELFAIHWTAKDYVSAEGDNNYNSTGANSAYYRSDREYLEIGALRRTRIDGPVTLDAEIRFHQFDGGVKSISLFDSRWEYSYRLVVRAPFELTLRP